MIARAGVRGKPLGIAGVALSHHKELRGCPSNFGPSLFRKIFFVCFYEVEHPVAQIVQ
jgi:hypothetical protein